MRRAAMLLELMLSLALFAAGALAILGVVRQSISSLDHARQTRRAADIARSAMARIEAGIDDPAAIEGPVALWDGRAAAMSAFDFNLSDDVPAPAIDANTLWELEVSTAPSQFADLSEVNVRAFRRASQSSDRAIASFTLTQLVRLGTRDEDIAGEQGELLDAAIRGAEPGGRP